MRHRLALVLAAANLVACEDEVVYVTSPAPDATDAETEAAPTREPISWSTCSFRTGGKDRLAQCAEIEVPLDWAKPEGRKIVYFVKRVLGSAPGKHAQLWLLQGGPGAAGDGLEPVAEEMLRQNGAIDVYLPDHRGTGRSAHLGCPKLNASVALPLCVREAQKEWGEDGFAAFNTTNAARDLGHAIERSREEGQDVHIYGVSYGTYLAQRYLQIFPEQPTSVTLDSVCQSGLCSLLKYSYWYDRVGRRFMEECGADAFCGSRLGPDPVQRVREAVAVADAKTCAGLSAWDGSTLRSVLSALLGSVQTRPLVPSIVFRTLRCNAEDVTALQNMTTEISGAFSQGFDPTPQQMRSTLLMYNIAYSEMEESPAPTQAEIATLMADAVFRTPTTAYEHGLYESWPKYPRDEYVGKYPVTKVPVLIMNGTLDPQTPHEFAEEVAAHFREPAQTFVSFPRGSHFVLYESPTTSGTSCGSVVFHQFLEDPKGALDTSCTSAIVPHTFDGHADLAQLVFHTDSLWDGVPDARPRSLETAQSKTIVRELLRIAADLAWPIVPPRP